MIMRNALSVLWLSAAMLPLPSLHAQEATTAGPAAGEAASEGEAAADELRDGAASAAGEGTSELAPMTIIGKPEALVRTVGSAHLVDAEDLQEFAYDDINRTLNEVPGLYIREEDGFGLRPNIGLRGANSDRSQKVTLMEDGVLFGPAPYAAPAAYFFPMTARMTGVEVFKGPAAIQHGPQTIGGAINMISAPIPEAAQGQLSVAGGSDAYGRLHARYGAPVGENWGFLAEVLHVRTDGFKNLDGGGDTGFDKTEVVLKGARRLGDGRLMLTASYANETSDETYLGLTESDFRDAPFRRYRASALDRMSWDRWSLRADLEQPLWGGQSIFTVYSHQFQRGWRKFNNVRDTDIRNIFANPDTPRNRLRLQVLRGDIDSDPGFAGDDILIGTNDRRFRSSGAQGRWLRSFGSGDVVHSVEVGMRLHSDRIRRLHDEFSFEMIDGSLQRNDVPRAITADNTGRASALAWWARDEIVFGRWTVAPGVRVEAIRTKFDNRLVGDSNRETQVVAIPGVGINFAQTPALNWLLGIHRGFSPATPSLEEAVEPEKALNFESGFRWASPVGRLEAIGFYSRYSNLTAQCTFSAGCDDAEIGQQINAGKVRVYGVETTWRYRQPLIAGLSAPLEASYTHTQGEFREAFESPNPQFGDVEPGDELPYVPAHRLNLQAGVAGQRWEGILSATYLSEMRDTAGRGSLAPGEGTDSYVVFDLAARIAVTQRVTLTARVDNLFDREYIVGRLPFGARPGKARTAQAGIDYRF